MSNEKITLQNHLNSLMDIGIDQIIIINENGRSEDLICRNKLTLSRNKQEIFFMSVRLHQSLIRDFDDEFGSSTCMVVERQNVKLVYIPFYSYTILAVMRKSINHEVLVRRICEIKNLHTSKLLEVECLRMEVLANHG